MNSKAIAQSPNGAMSLNKTTLRPLQFARQFEHYLLDQITVTAKYKTQHIY